MTNFSNQPNPIQKTSPNLLDERIQSLKTLMPDLFDGDGNLDEIALRDLAKSYSEPRAEKFTFNWSGKQGSKRIAYEPSQATLKSNIEGSKNLDTTKNLLIEGDNLEVLKLLQKSYYQKVKCIYIDPPYNTGKDFIYPDNYGQTRSEYWQDSGAVDSEGVKLESNPDSSGKYHSNWLNMMQPRLLLARNLMREDGVIFVSIDDHEVHNLRKLMDEVFGEENFVGNIAWESKTKSQNTKDSFNKLQPKVEYILCYTKQDLKRFILIQKGEKDYLLNDDKGTYREYQLEVMDAGGMRGRETMVFEIQGILPPNGKQWKIGQDKISEFIKRGDLFVRNSKIVLKKRTEDEISELYEPFWGFASKEIGTAESAKKELSKILNSDKHGFETVKPINLIKKFIFHSSSSNDIILDFFAGSGTTAQAVMELNSEDGGNRQFILVQIPEKTDKNSEAYKAGYKTIFDICGERIRRAGDKIMKNEKMKVSDDLDIGFRVLTLADSHFPENTFNQDPELSEAENLASLENYIQKEMQYSLLDVDDVDGLTLEIALKQGFDLGYTATKITDFKSNTVYLIVDESQKMLLCLDTAITKETVENLNNHLEINFVCLKSALDTTNKWNIERIITKDRLFVI
jgi:adenine-specific DNA-methyltransferase